MNDHLDVDRALAALRDERDEVPSRELGARLLDRLERSIALAPGGDPSLARDAASSAAGSAAPVAQATSIALAFSLGAALGGGAMALFQASSERMVLVSTKTAPASVAQLGSAQPTAKPDAFAPKVPSAIPSASASLHPMPVLPAASSRTQDKRAIEDQQELLDRARVELARGNSGAALSSIELHRRRFPTTWLEQERQALAIRALLAAGRRADALRAYRTFERRFHRSPLLASLRAMLEQEHVTESNDERQ